MDSAILVFIINVLFLFNDKRSTKSTFSIMILAIFFLDLISKCYKLMQLSYIANLASINFCLMS